MVTHSYGQTTPDEQPAVILKKETTRARSDSGAIEIYLREIGRVDLLTPEQEVALAKRVQAGDAEAREHMIKGNLRLVVKIAHDFEGLGLPLLDLINEGNIGLMKAVDRFDPTKGAKLSTYAAWWIRQSMKRALANQGKTIRLPIHVVDKVSRIRRTSLQLFEQLDREPTDEEIAEVLDLPASQVGHIRSVALQPASLDAPIESEDSAMLAEIVKDERALDPFEDLADRTMRRVLPRLISSLNPREAEILRCRFGLDDGEEKTLDSVGQMLGVSRERVRQLQNSALRKLRTRLDELELTTEGLTAPQEELN